MAAAPPLGLLLTTAMQRRMLPQQQGLVSLRQPQVQVLAQSLASALHLLAETKALRSARRWCRRRSRLARPALQAQQMLALLQLAQAQRLLLGLASLLAALLRAPKLAVPS